MMSGVLDGIRVLDFSSLLPGPMATLFLVDAGAEVIKIENPRGGDDMRHYTPMWGDTGANFHLLNSGKKSVALDLKSPQDQARLQSLLQSADILIEQFRPGVMARLGLSFDDVLKIKPNIIYCSITGYGQTGPDRMRAGHDLNYIGDTGLLALSHGTPRAPVTPPALVADIAAGTYPALINLLLALRRRDQTGEGAYLDISMTDNLFPFLYWALSRGQATGEWPGNGDALVTGGTPRYRLYATADNRFAAVAAIEQKFWDAFCDLIALETDLRDDTRDSVATTSAVAEIILGKPADHWQQIFHTADCCCTIVQSLEAAMSNPHFAARGLFARRISGPEGAVIAALPTPISPDFRSDGSRTFRAPALGEHTNACAHFHQEDQ